MSHTTPGVNAQLRAFYDAQGLMCAFVWEDSREGARYWYERNRATLTPLSAGGAL